MHRHGWGLGKRLGLGHHGGWRQHRQERLFEHGDLRFVVLALVAEKARHGYEVIKAIEEKSGGAYTPSPGVVYPTLTMLEELGYVSQTAEGTKKLYAITPEGEAWLAQNRGVIDALAKRMDHSCSIWGRGPAPQVVRAMKNLSTAVQMRFKRGPMSEEQALAIATAIDAAVRVAEEA